MSATRNTVQSHPFNPSQNSYKLVECGSFWFLVLIAARRVWAQDYCSVVPFSSVHSHQKHLQLYECILSIKCGKVNCVNGLYVTVY